MENNHTKPKLDESEGSLFAEVREALEELLQAKDKPSKDALLECLEKHNDLFTEVNELIASDFLDEYDIKESYLMKFHDTFQDMIFHIKLDE